MYAPHPPSPGGPVARTLTPPPQAASNCDLPFSKWLLSRCTDMDLNGLTSDGSTALHLAAAKGHLPMVQWLVGAGADISVLDRFRRDAQAVVGARRAPPRPTSPHPAVPPPPARSPPPPGTCVTCLVHTLALAARGCPPTAPYTRPNCAVFANPLVFLLLRHVWFTPQAIASGETEVADFLRATSEAVVIKRVESKSLRNSVFEAVRSGNVDALSDCVRVRGADINDITTKAGQNVLHVACSSGGSLGVLVGCALKPACARTPRLWVAHYAAHALREGPAACKNPSTPCPHPFRFLSTTRRSLCTHPPTHTHLLPPPSIPFCRSGVPFDALEVSGREPGHQGRHDALALCGTGPGARMRTEAHMHSTQHACTARMHSTQHACTARSTHAQYGARVHST
jgi:hypothetical protein